MSTTTQIMQSICVQMEQRRIAYAQQYDALHGQGAYMHTYCMPEQWYTSMKECNDRANENTRPDPVCEEGYDSDTNSVHSYDAYDFCKKQHG